MLITLPSDESLNAPNRSDFRAISWVAWRRLFSCTGRLQRFCRFFFGWPLKTFRSGRWRMCAARLFLWSIIGCIGVIAWWLDLSSSRRTTLRGSSRSIVFVWHRPPRARFCIALLHHRSLWWGFRLHSVTWFVVAWRMQLLSPGLSTIALVPVLESSFAACSPLDFE